jgi:hypothetical protein
VCRPAMGGPRRPAITPMRPTPRHGSC